ncbi:SusC/RagA family TonB-linked outer membrane protein [Dyadobacter psychrotolerans]|uniref:TonB-dependent receptor n=1 Tax=Dyadobacter psychrotolerans TaxID=2541721 RepID=A0A4R5DA78_9BACT|nr:TonB-dependent receptor [Dyadobacter psychrotolerans]TDE10506.1 TonB-dependent receptor [Dyadobacter psychrotolerans]
MPSLLKSKKPNSIMRLSIPQFLLVLLLSTAIGARGKDAHQDLLGQNVTVNLKNVALSKALSEIEKQGKIRFAYSRSLIPVKQIVSVNADGQPLSLVLDKLLLPLAIEYQSVKGQIMLKRKPVSESVTPQQKTLNTESSPEQPADLNISGKVTDEKGDGLPGVSIIVKGTQTGSTTNVDGTYSLAVPDSKAVLIFSFVGYLSQEVIVGSRSGVDVVLKVDEKALEEVVVVGYGTQKRSDITGAISSINVKDLDGVPLRSMDQALQGRVAGVFLTSGGGQPGAANSIRIRGGNSINGSNEPLYVIDGIPIYVAPTDGAANSLNPLNSISPTDIASIEVLKDASATAIYGARGGNGVVLITTKRGKAGESRIDLDVSYGFQKELKRYDLLNAKQFETLANEASQADGGPLLYDPNANPETTDWQSYIFRRNAPIKDYKLSASGGDKSTQYLLTFGYYKQDGVMKNTDMERYSLRLNVDRQIKDRIKIGNNLTFSNVQSNRSRTSTILLNAPDLPVRQPDGSYTRYDKDGVGFNNPVGLLNDSRSLNKVFRGLGNVFATVEILEGLNFKTMWGLDASFNKNDSYTPQSVHTGAEVGGNASVNTNQNLVWLNENTLDFTRAFKDHKINILAGYTQQSARYEALSASATGFLNDNTGSNNLGLGNPGQAVLPGSSTAAWSILSWIGRANYTFKSRYLFTVTGRYDGSSRFGNNNSWGFFPSAALAWRIIEEPFMKNLKDISDFKLRVSHGVTGNQDGIGNYPALDLWGAANYVLNNQVATGITPTQLANKNLRWESTASTDMGLELGLFNNRLSFVFDAYYKKTSNLLLNISVPATSGFINGTKNIGSVQNKGLEFTVNAIPVDGQFSWNTSFNVALNRNKILNLGGSDEIIPSTDKKSALLKVGQPLGNFYGYISDGLFQSAQEVKDGAQPLAKPGDVRFIDYNDDKIINATDRRVMGNAQPKLYGGFTNTFSYKGIELSAFLQFVYGNSIYNENTLNLENMLGSANQSITVLDRWTPQNTDTNIPRATTTKPTGDPYDRYVEDGSYLRLKNVQLSYNIPLKKPLLIGIRTIKAYMNVQNLLTFTKYSGLDPEVNRYGSNNVLQGYDLSPYPNVRTTTFGLNIGF